MPRGWILLLAILVGLLLGLGSFTFIYAEGTSYFSSNPDACVNCHIMRSEYDSWQRSGHRAKATCVECHLPHAFVPKWIAKATNGFRHSLAFTLQNFPEPIQITRHNAAILQDNCLNCHGAMVHELVSGGPAELGPPSCVHCHRSVGHGNPGH